MADTFFIEGLNTLPEQVQLNKEDIKKLSDSSNAQIQALTTKIDKNATDIDNLSKKVYDNGRISFYLGYSSFIFKDNKAYNYFSIHRNGVSSWSLEDIELFNFQCTVYINGALRVTNGYLYADSLVINTSADNDITNISNSNATDSHSLLTGKAINDTFLTKTDASNTYVTKQDYEERIDTGDITLTKDGFDKISTMTEEVGTTIILTETSDFTEHIQVTNTRELILNVNYNGDPIYRNIHLMPNQTINDYTAVQDGIENWYTGHAILILPSEDDGYFAVSYQNDNYSQLILTLIAHY